VVSVGSVISQGEVGKVIDSGINALQHPFFMVIFGIAFWFLFLWSIKRNKMKELKINYWNDQKDEILVTLMFGFMFLVWNDEIIQAYYDATDREGDPELKIYYYLLVGPAVDRIYWLYRKATNGDSSH
jgi:hypothetical protein